LKITSVFCRFFATEHTEDSEKLLAWCSWQVLIPKASFVIETSLRPPGSLKELPAYE